METALFETGWSAAFSECRTYRYELTRQFKERDTSRMVIVMLNPSTADAFKNDPTVARCCKLAQRYGHTSLVVLNLFALRSTDPKALKSYRSPVGPDNDGYLFKWLTAPLTERVVCAWGTYGALLGRADAIVPQMRAWFRGRDLECLGRTGGGHPRHPLYVRGDKELEVF